MPWRGPVRSSILAAMRNRHTRFGLTAAALTAALACRDGRAQSEGTSVAGALATITPADVAARVGLLAHDSMRGRDTPSPELEEVARYIAGEFRRLGLEPGAAGGEYIQRYPIVVRRGGGARLEVPGGPSVEAGDGFALYPRSGVPDTLAHPVWYAGTDPARVSAAPPGALWLVPAERLESAAFRSWGRAARERGAAMIAFVLPDDAASLTARLARGDRTSVRLGSGDGDGGGREALPILLLTQTTATRLFGPDARVAALSGDGAPHALDARARVRADVQVEVTTAPNVIGILRGSDPQLKDEYVFFSAHMDHVGVGAPLDGDSIYNGADDNASGTATILEIAEAFSHASPRPRRSMAFLLVSGEEKGLYGSQWFSEHPTVPLARVVADLNVDMVGRNWADTIVAIGKAQSSLGATVDSVARAHPELRLTVLDDLWPQERFYFRSDHYNFARRGVPILFFFNGVHEDYHRPSDEPSKIRSEKAARIARLIALTGWAVADADARPRWDPEARAQVVETP